MSNTILTNPNISDSGELRRVTDLFFSPERLFRNILHNRSWWLPFVLTLACSAMQTWSAVRQVGIPQLSMNVMRSDPATVARFDDLPPDQQQATLQSTITAFKISSYCTPVLIITYNVLYAIVLWGALALVGGRVQFGPIFAVLMYADLIQDVRAVLGTITVYLLPDPRSFNLQTPVGSNIGYFLDPGVGWLRSLAESADILTIWYLILISLGCAIVAKVPRKTAAIIVFGLWFLIVLTRVIWAAM